MTRSPQTPSNKHLVCLPGGNRRTQKSVHFPIPKPPQPLSPQTDSPDSENFISTLQQLEERAIRINQLSMELESAIAEFKEIGDRVDGHSIHFRKDLGHHWFPQPICSYREVKIPYIHQTEAGILILSSRHSQYFAAQKEALREANSIAHLLRQRSLAKQPTIDSNS